MQSARQLASLALLFIGAGTAGYFAYRLTATAPVADIPQMSKNIAPLDAVEVADPDGTLHALGKWRGQPQIVNFWATWCAPCREEMPLLVDMQKKYAEQGLVVLAMSMDYPDDTQIVKEFVTQYAMPFPVLMVAEAGNQIAAAYGADNFVLPISVFVNAQGEVAHVHTGMLKPEQTEAMIADIL